MKAHFYTAFKKYLTLLVASLISSAWGQNGSFCDPNISTNSNDPNAYEDRANANNQTDRCEGLFIQEVSASSIITLTSFTRQFDLTGTGNNQPATISWNTTSLADLVPFQDIVDDAVNIRANSNRFRVYYRMDTEVPVQNGSFEWSTNVLAQLSLERRDIGLYGFVPVEFSEIDREVYIPLFVFQGEQASSNTYQAVFVPRNELEDVRFYVSQAEDGYPTDIIIPEQSLGYRNYPNATPIVIDFEISGDAGLYLLHVEAERSRGRNVSESIYFYHEP